MTFRLNVYNVNVLDPVLILPDFQGPGTGILKLINEASGTLTSSGRLVRTP